MKEEEDIKHGHKDGKDGDVSIPKVGSIDFIILFVEECASGGRGLTRLSSFFPIIKDLLAEDLLVSISFVVPGQAPQRIAFEGLRH
jgi:hypothetical protein